MLGHGLGRVGGYVGDRDAAASCRVKVYCVEAGASEEDRPDVQLKQGDQDVTIADVIDLKEREEVKEAGGKFGGESYPKTKIYGGRPRS